MTWGADEIGCPSSDGDSEGQSRCETEQYAKYPMTCPVANKRSSRHDDEWHYKRPDQTEPVA